MQPSLSSAAHWLTQPDSAIAIDRERCERSLSHFVRSGWPNIDPAEYVHNWHIDAIAEHLEAVTRGDIKRLLINIPPRHAKSLMVSVAWSAWTWALQRSKGKWKDAPLAGPQTKFLALSYSSDLSTRDNVKTRWLIDSPWYQRRWGDRFKFAADQNAKTRFVNSAKGHRIASSFTGLATGEGGDVIIIDDAHNVLAAESDTERPKVCKVFAEVLQTRLNDVRTGAFVLIMQRTHEEDLPGYVLANMPGVYTHLCLPARYESDHPHAWARDPRKEGELLWPAKIPEPDLKALETAMGEYATAGQMQQRPAPREGGLFKTDAIEIVDALPTEGALVFVRAWDFAGTAGAGAYSAGVLMAKHWPSETYYFVDVRRDQLSPASVQKLVKATAQMDRKDYGPRLRRIRIPQDPGQAGKGQVTDYAKLLDGYPLKWLPVTGDKETRALPLATQVEAGRVKMLKGAWNRPLIDEMRTFPAGKFKDQVDAAADAYVELLEAPKPMAPVGPIMVPLR